MRHPPPVRIVRGCDSERHHQRQRERRERSRFALEKEAQGPAEAIGARPRGLPRSTSAERASSTWMVSGPRSTKTKSEAE